MTTETKETVRSVRTIIGAEAAYACIQTTGRSLDVRLHAGHSAVASLRLLAIDEREKAERLLRRAAVMDEAAGVLELRGMKP